MTSETFHTPSRREVETAINEASMLRAEAIVSLFAGLGRAIKIGARAVFTGLISLAQSYSDAIRARDLYTQLSNLGDRELADIGLTRGDIPAVVTGVFVREGDRAPTSDESDPARSPVTTLRSEPIAAKSELREAA